MKNMRTGQHFFSGKSGSSGTCEKEGAAYLQRSVVDLPSIDSTIRISSNFINHLFLRQGVLKLKYALCQEVSPFALNCRYKSDCAQSDCMTQQHVSYLLMKVCTNCEKSQIFCSECFFLFLLPVLSCSFFLLVAQQMIKGSQQYSNNSDLHFRWVSLQSSFPCVKNKSIF